jgi:hypothetical protein
VCSIIGSFKKEKIIELCELNAYRGQQSHSIGYYDPDIQDFFYICRSYGPVNYDMIDIPEDNYCVVHMQAPTTDSDDDSIHPAAIGRSLLWHNGILKQKEIQRLQKIFNTDETWDTYLLLMQMINKGTPENIDGTFSCLYYNGSNLHLFRNEISPMFIDNDCNISSTKFEGSHPTKENTLYLFRPERNILNEVFTFKTVENPYYFGGD